jgi:hypothetical protein
LIHVPERNTLDKKYYRFFVTQEAGGGRSLTLSRAREGRAAATREAVAWAVARVEAA